MNLYNRWSLVTWLIHVTAHISTSIPFYMAKNLYIAYFHCFFENFIQCILILFMISTNSSQIHHHPHHSQNFVSPLSSCLDFPSVMTVTWNCKSYNRFFPIMLLVRLFYHNSKMKLEQTSQFLYSYEEANLTPNVPSEYRAKVPRMQALIRALVDSHTNRPRQAPFGWACTHRLYEEQDQSVK